MLNSAFVAGNTKQHYNLGVPGRKDVVLGGLQVFQGGLERFLGRSWEIPFGPRAQMVVVFCVSDFFREKPKQTIIIIIISCVFLETRNASTVLGSLAETGCSWEALCGSWGALGRPRGPKSAPEPTF